MRGKFGSTAYNFAQKFLHWPIVSERTLQERTEAIKFEPGIQRFMITVLGKKLLAAKSADDPLGLGCYAGLTLDEMKIEYFSCN
jgi:hypothetical protein